MGKDFDTLRSQIKYKGFYTQPIRDYYDRAMAECEAENDVETAKMIVRTKRNEILAKTDSHMSLDRIGLTTPAYTLTGLIEFVRTIMKALTGDWAKYRQALRDIPDQPGFPFSVVWPEEPED